MGGDLEPEKGESTQSSKGGEDDPVLEKENIPVQGLMGGTAMQEQEKEGKNLKDLQEGGKLRRTRGNRLRKGKGTKKTAPESKTREEGLRKKGT